MTDADADAAPAPPSLEALVAGTVALMTTWADPPPAVGAAQANPRVLLARKIVSNLFFLQHHPCASPGLQQVMARAHQRWVAVAASAPGQARCETQAPGQARRVAQAPVRPTDLH